MGYNLGKVLDYLNEYLDGLDLLLDGTLEIGEHVAGKFIELTLSDTAIPLSVKNPLKGQPRSVQICQAREKTGGPVGAAVSVGWVFRNGEIVIDEVYGLTTGKIYTIKLVVM